MANTQTARIAALEAKIVDLETALTAWPAALEQALRTALTAALQPLALRTEHAHERLDAAGHAFKRLNLSLKAEPFTPPPPATTKRLPRAEFDAALKSLRDEDAEHGGSQSFFPTAMIQRRAATMRAEAEAA